MDKQRRVAERKAERQKGGFRRGKAKGGKEEQHSWPQRGGRSTKKGAVIDKPQVGKGTRNKGRAKQRR